MSPKRKLPAPDEQIIVKGARTHNLKNISVSMPRNAMVAITGLSGSGKSSLAFDTIFAEGQRRYVESLSAYARQFLNQMPKPDVDEISGLSPAISIDQKSRSNNPRSTVATITEIYDYLRVLYARVGKPECLECGRPIQKLSLQEIVDAVLQRVESFENKGGKKAVMGVTWSDTPVHIFAPVVRGRKGEYYQLLYDMLGAGYADVRVDGTMHSLRETITLSKHKKHNLDFLVDTLLIHEFKDNKEGAKERLSESIERAVKDSDGVVLISFGDAQKSYGVSRDSVDTLEPHEYVLSSKFACAHDGFSFPDIEPRLFSFNSPYGACPECNGLGVQHLFGNESDDACHVCQGARLRPESLHVFLYDEHGAKKNIVQITEMTISQAIDFFCEINLSKTDREVAKVIVREIEARLGFMYDVGLTYLSLNRRANTLSGGEAQRIRLASQLGSQLVGALYVLDEPTIGLHQRDNDRLIKTLVRLRDLGNTILVVEHDEDTVLASDYLIDIGPGAGVHGGSVVVSGYLDELLDAPKNTSKSRTLSYLRGEHSISVPEKRRTGDKGIIHIEGGSCHNIQNLTVDIPLGRLVVVSGVSGSGKSTFLYEILHKNLLAQYDRRYRSAKVYNCSVFKGDSSLTRTILVDQSPIGRTPRSNPATYTGAWGPIRELFASTQEARVRGWKAGRFSFNVKGGRCEACQGNGVIAVEMHFLPTVYVTCEVCNGKRFDPETLKVYFKKKNVYEILQMTVEEALALFHDIPSVADRLQTLVDVGLGYLTLGQSATTLSGGEAQRVKIASELYRPMTARTMYLLDEPTVGLHFDDVALLIQVLNKLVDRGHSVIVIEHNLDILKTADYLLDFGPEGGSGGGILVAKGTPEDVAGSTKSHTGAYLKKVLKRKR